MPSSSIAKSMVGALGFNGCNDHSDVDVCSNKHTETAGNSESAVSRRDSVRKHTDSPLDLQNEGIKRRCSTRLSYASSANKDFLRPPPTRPLGNRSRALTSAALSGGRAGLSMTQSNREADIDWQPPEVVENGVIVSVPDHIHVAGKTVAGNENETVSLAGVVLTKTRPFVVVARFEHHFVGLPLYTFSGRGIAHRSSQHEFIPIQTRPRPELSNPLQAIVETPNRILWAISHTAKGGVSQPTIAEKSHVYITRPTWHDLKARHCIWGRLDTPSLELLMDLWIKSMTSTGDFRFATASASSRAVLAAWRSNWRNSLAPPSHPSEYNKRGSWRPGVCDKENESGAAENGLFRRPSFQWPENRRRSESLMIPTGPRADSNRASALSRQGTKFF